MKRSILAIGAALCLAAGQHPASSIQHQAAIAALIGEAGNQDYATMLAVAGAIRNRNSLQGVYGLNNPCVRNASAALRQRAMKAWLESATHNTARGCRYFGCPADAKYFDNLGLTPAFHQGAITFYR
jgi:hypothetical protein